MDNLFFTSWESFGRTFIIAIMAYLSIVVLLRSSGKRTLSKMNAFDFIVTVAFGSSLASVSLNKNIPLLEGILFFALLISLQFSITWLSVRFKFIKNLVTSKPTLLLYNGELYEDIMKRERITMEEVLFMARKRGFDSLQEIDAIILETTGDITVVSKIKEKDEQVLSTVRKPKEN